jgi:hypothetical protein
VSHRNARLTVHGDLTDALMRCLPDGDPRRAILAGR